MLFNLADKDVTRAKDWKLKSTSFKLNMMCMFNGEGNKPLEQIIIGSSGLSITS